MFSLSNCALKPSRTLILFYIGVHLLALFSVFKLDAETFTKIVSVVLIMLVFYCTYWRYISFMSPLSITHFTWLADDKVLRLTLRNGASLEACSVQQRLVLPFMVYLLVEVEERLGLQPVIIFHDSCRQDSFRRLKVLANFAVVER